MNTLVLYDSTYGNTEQIARAIGDGIKGKVRVFQIGKTNIADLDKIDLLIVGSPVHGGRPTPAMEDYLKHIPDEYLTGMKVAVFDTRFAAEDHGLGMRVLMNIIRYAAGRMGTLLTKKGAVLVAKPEGFIVEDKEGPIKKGELERAVQWATSVGMMADKQ